MSVAGVTKIIKTAREQCRYSQTDFGKMFGVSKQAVCSWEKGRNLPNAAVFMDIFKLSGLSIGDVE